MFNSVLNSESLSLNELNTEQRTLLLAAISRYHSSVNAQLFIKLLEYWNSSDQSIVSHIDINDKVISNAVLYIKTFHSDIVHVFYSLFQCLQDTKYRSLLIWNKTISIKQFIDLLLKFGINLQTEVLDELFKVLTLAEAYQDDESICMPQLVRLTNILMESQSQSYEVKNKNDSICFHILEKLKDQSQLLLSHLYSASSDNMVDMNTLHKVIKNIGIILSNNDMDRLWYYLFEEKDGNALKSVLIDKLASLLRINESANSFLPSHWSDKVHFPRRKSFRSGYNEKNRSEMGDLLKQNDFIQNRTPIHHVKISNPVESYQDESNLRHRMISRINTLRHEYPERYDEFLKSVLCVEDTSISRSIIFHLFIDFGVSKLQHSQCDEIWLEICRYNHRPTVTGLLTWLGISRDEIRHFQSELNKYVDNSNVEIKENLVTEKKHSKVGDERFPDKSKTDSDDFQNIENNQNLLNLSSNNIKPKDSKTPEFENLYHNAIPEVTSRNHNKSMSDRMEAILGGNIKAETSLNHNTSKVHLNQSDRLKAIDILQRNRANLAFAFRKLIGAAGRLDDNSVSCKLLAQAITSPPISVPLQQVEAELLVNEMTNQQYNIDTTLTSTSRIYFRDILSYLDTCVHTSPVTADESPVSSSYKDNYFRSRIKVKLENSADVCGDRLKLIALSPRLKHRHRLQRRYGNDVDSMITCNNDDITGCDVVSLHDLKILMHSIDLLLDNDDIKYIYDQIISNNIDNSNRSYFEVSGLKLSDVILFLSKLLDSE